MLLWQVSADKASSIVILAEAGDADRADAETLRCVIALESFEKGLNGHIVAEVRDIDNEPLVRLMGGRDVETMVSHDVLGRLMLMSARQPGLASVYQEVLGFDGDEFYMKDWPELTGVPFGDLVNHFPCAIPVGLRTRTGQMVLKPANDRKLRSGEEVIVIAEDDDTYNAEPRMDIPVGEVPEYEEPEKRPEKILFCGWRRDVRDVLLHLDELVEPGSQVHMMTDALPMEQRDIRLREEGLDTRQLTNLDSTHKAGNTSVRRKLMMLPIEEYTSCMIFAEQQYEQGKMV